MAKELKFEEMMKKLEEIVDELESGNMPLEDSLKKIRRRREVDPGLQKKAGRNKAQGRSPH